MNELSTIVDGDRMTSLQIAEITGRRHTDVMRAIRNMEPAWDKEECFYIATKFNDEARAKLIKRWKELEEQHQKPSVPQNYLEALKSLVKAEEEKLELESMRIQHKVRGQWILFAQFLEGGYVHSRAVDIIRKDGQHDVKYNTEWTTKGRIFLYE